MSKELSEFGKGFISCLVNFAAHFERDYKMFEEFGGEMWFNGASDHLYEITTPSGEQWNEVREKVKQLKEHGLHIGHGFSGEQFSKEDILTAFKLTREIAVLTDKVLGLESDSGQWS